MMSPTRLLRGLKHTVREIGHTKQMKKMFIPKVSYAEALQALQKVWLYEEQHKNGYSEWISRINRHERVMRARGFQELKQASIKAFF